MIVQDKVSSPRGRPGAKASPKEGFWFYCPKTELTVSGSRRSRPVNLRVTEPPPRYSGSAEGISSEQDVFAQSRPSWKRTRTRTIETRRTKAKIFLPPKPGRFYRGFVGHYLGSRNGFSWATGFHRFGAQSSNYQRQTGECFARHRICHHRSISLLRDLEPERCRKLSV
jgi:hypothetical protein